jgi:hypothetical protein
MSQYAFEAEKGSDGKILMGVTITHDPELCNDRGINCSSLSLVTSTHSSGYATMAFSGDELHYFRATFPGQPPVVTNNFTTGMNQSRFIGIVFNGL